MRADASRNRASILVAARALVAEVGPALSMDDLARSAGVAVGTLYRHFPSKSALVAAVVEDSVAAIAADTEAALDAVAGGTPAGQALATVFRLVARRHSTDRSVKAAAQRLGLPVPGTTAAADSPAARRALAALGELLAAADRAGALASPTTVLDMMVLLDGVPGAEIGETQRERYVETVLRGLLRPAALQAR